MEKCKNCSTDFKGNFCPNCGQRPNSGRIIFKESAQEILEHYFDFDAPLFRTIGGLVTNPGKVIREYIEGKRKSYSHPFRYFILVLAVYLIIKSLIDFDPIKTFSQILGTRELPNPNTVSTKGANFFSNNINSFLILYSFTLALFGKLFNWKSKFFFAEYWVMSFFIVSQYMFFSIFITLSTLITPYFFILNYIFIFIYPMYVQVSLFEGKLLARLIKSFFVSLLGWAFYGILGQTISIFIVIFFGL